MGRVVVAMDPHKRSATIEVMDAEETVLGGGRFGTDAAGFAAMKTYAAASWTVMSLSPARGLSGLGGLVMLMCSLLVWACEDLGRGPSRVVGPGRCGQPRTRLAALSLSLPRGWGTSRPCEAGATDGFVALLQEPGPLMLGSLRACRTPKS